MTKIVKFKTKKELKKAVQTGIDFFINDPSIFSSSSYMASEIPEGISCAVTNHPKRSWFASIIKKDGKLIVK